jgi:hypothetical protein
LKDSAYFNYGDKLNLEFDFLGTQITLPVEVINRHTVKGQNGYGVKFNFKSFRQNVQVSKIIGVIKRSSKAF